MTASNFGKRLALEFKRGGKKSIVLGLLLLVGLGFWLPMVWKGKGSGSKSSSATATSSKTSSNRPPASTPSATPDSTPPPSRSSADWKALRVRLDNSSVLGPAAMDERVRDPFERGWIRELAPKVDAKTTNGDPGALDPSKTFVCSSILVGPSIRMAVIGDDTCQVGDEIPKDPKQGTVQYLVKEILEDKVLLERDGDVFPVPLKKPKNPAGVTPRKSQPETAPASQEASP